MKGDMIKVTMGGFGVKKGEKPWSYIFTETPSLYKDFNMYLATESQASGGCVGSSHL